MILRFLLRRGLLPLVAVLGFMAVPSVALAADTFSVTPCNSGCTPNNATLTANGPSSFTLDAAITESSPITDVASNLTPGLLLNLTANPVCLGTPPVSIGSTTAHSATCQTGTGNIHTNAPSDIAVDTFETAGASGDPAGFDIVDHASGTTIAHAELSLIQTANGPVVGHLDLPVPSSFQTALETSGHLTFKINGTMNGNPATRMPSNCNPPLASALIVNGTQTATASPDVKDDAGFAATCGPLPYNPQLTASATKDTSDNGTAVDTTITQAPGEAASLTNALTTPSGTLAPNAAAIALQCTAPNATFSNCTQVGTATTLSPLVPIPESGFAYLTGTGIANITLTLYFPGLNLKLVGAQNIITNTLTFSKAAGGLDIPDIPLTSLHVHLNGGPTALFTTSCSPANATITSQFTSQNGKSASPSAPFMVTNCSSTPTAGKPTIGSSSLSGLAKGKPHLHFTVNQGSNAPKLKKVVVKLSGGLKFLKKFKKKQKGFKVSGGKVKSAKITNGRLVITLKSAVSSVTVKLGPPALQESTGLKKKAKKKKVKKLTVIVTATDANNLATSIKLTFNNPH